MKILSLNVCCGELYDPLPLRRLTAQAEKILFLDADVLCLQEVNNPLVRHVLERRLGSRYRFLTAPVSTKIILSRVLAFSLFVLVNRSVVLFLGLLWVWLFFLGTVEGGLAVLVSHHIPVCDHGFVPFREQRGDVLNLFQKRGVLWCETPSGIIGNTHLNRHHRHEAQLRQLATAKDWWVLAGDLNTDRIEPIGMERLPTDPTWGNDTIDHVFVRDDNGWKTRLVDLCSDHRGIFTVKM